jgi:hypothetical protein
MNNKWISAEINDQTSALNRKIRNSEEKERDRERAVRRQGENEVRIEQRAKKQK